MLARGRENELTLHGHYLFTEWFISFHKYKTTSKQRKLICEYIETRADEFLSKYPSDPNDYDGIFSASCKMLMDAVPNALKR
jgi:hypothetical protein